jgi:hypothetical protein
VLGRRDDDGKMKEKVGQSRVEKRRRQEAKDEAMR